MFSALRQTTGTIWCRMMHESLLWPVHGHYHCRTCGRRYPAFAEAPVANWTRPAAWKPAVSLMVAMILATFAGPVRATAGIRGYAALEADAALERYTSGGGAERWTVESVEIHASLSKLAKTGQLRAIRRLLPTGESSYEVLQFAGDRTVKEQVIVRYLNSEARASGLPPASVAITPTNYKFTYKGTVDDGERVAYTFQITPRRRGPGLIKGELWLDQRTGVPVLEFGRLVKSPSVWIKRVTVSRENAIHDGAESRLTHLTVETRLVGRAELVIEERPLRSAEGVQFANLQDQGGQQ
jgi:hypothetical protein